MVLAVVVLVVVVVVGVVLLMLMLLLVLFMLQVLPLCLLVVLPQLLIMALLVFLPLPLHLFLPPRSIFHPPQCPRHDWSCIPIGWRSCAPERKLMGIAAKVCGFGCLISGRNRMKVSGARCPTRKGLRQSNGSRRDLQSPSGAATRVASRQWRRRGSCSLATAR